MIHHIDNIDSDKYFCFSDITHTNGIRFNINLYQRPSYTKPSQFIRTVKAWNSFKYETKSYKSPIDLKCYIDQEVPEWQYENGD